MSPVALRARPTVTITSPTGGVWLSPTLTVEWSATAQTEAVVELLDEQGVLVESRQVGPSVRTASFTVQDYTQYTVRVTVSDAYQSSLPASVTVTVQLERPAPPDLRATFRADDASVLLEASIINGLKIARLNLGPVKQWLQPGTGPVGFADTDGAVVLFAPDKRVPNGSRLF